MTAHTASKIVRHEAPGEVRAAVLDPDGRPFRLFALRWRGVGEPARYGGTYTARLRKFADELCGAFLELDSGEEAFLRLKSRRDVTEGMALNVRVESEARQGKLARVMRVAEVSEHSDPFEHWCSQVSPGARCEIYADRDAVNAAFEEAFSKSVTLFGGGHLHIDRTRALTAFDLDTAGRAEKGSAGARALSINRDAAAEMARQVSLRNLGGNLVLDCVGPLNKKSGDLIREAARAAFLNYGIADVNVLRPSPLGLLEASAPWRSAPVEDLLAARPAETALLDQFRDVQRAAQANPTALYRLELSKSEWSAYLQKRGEADAALQTHLGGRITLAPSETDESRIQKR